MDQPWRIQMFGGLRAEQGDRVISRFYTQKNGALFAYLAYHCRRAHPREVLIELLWPGREPAAGRNNLSTALSSLRNQFEPPGIPRGSVIQADRFFVQLNPAAITTDVSRFEGALKSAGEARSEAEQAQFLVEAVELYHGELLPGYYQDWIITEQRRLADLYFQAVQRLVTHCEGTREWERALDCARRAVAIDPLREEAHDTLMRLLVVAGQPSEAIRQYQELERTLREELDCTPSEPVRELARKIQSRSADSVVPLSAPVAEPSQPPSSSLPTGTLTFLVADIEGAAQDAPEKAVESALADCNDAVCEAFRRFAGHQLKKSAGSFTIAFEHASNALACAIEIQNALAVRSWPEGLAAPRLRMALDTREVRPRTGESPGWLLCRATGLLRAAHGGQILCSDTSAALLAGSLGTDVRVTDLGFYRLQNIEAAERLFAIKYPGAVAEDFPPPQSPRAHISNLPLQFTSFFGREEELGRLEEMLSAEEIHLVTLTGLGGCGKTRLALEVARQLFETFRGALWFVDLQNLSDPILVGDAVLEAMRLTRSYQTEPLDQVLVALSDQPSLLVLDNFEHLVEGGAEVVRVLLERVPSLTCLVTSRQRLDLAGEHEFPVEPLPLPVREDSPEGLMRCASVELFVDRAQAVRPDFQVTRKNAAAVAEICHRLEGIPLALELAAAWTQVLPPARMLEQLEHRFDFLVTGKRGVPERHKTLRAAMEWSYRLLSSESQRFLTRLSVFRGGWTTEAAETVCEEPQALNSLAQLQARSLVRTDEPDKEGEEMRFLMLETLREFVDGQLTPGERASIGQQHAEYYLALAEEAEPCLQGEEQAMWLERLEKEHDNLRAALEWCKTSETSAELGRRLAGALWQFWHVRGYPSEGRAHFADLLAQKGTPAHTAAQAKALNAAGNLAAEQGDYAAARSLFEQSLAIQRELGNKEGIACSLNNLGLVAETQGDHAAAQTFFQESLAIHRELDDKPGIARLLANQGNLAADLGDTARARALYEESLAIERELGDRQGIAAALNNLGDLAEALGDHKSARSMYEQALDLNREIANRAWEATNLHNLGRVAASEGDSVAAGGLFQESMAIWRELGEQRGIACSLEKLAEVAVAQERPEQAARLFGAAEALRERIGAPLPPNERDAHDLKVAAVQTALGKAAFSSKWADGRTMSLEESVDCALDIGFDEGAKPDTSK